MALIHVPYLQLCVLCLSHVFLCLILQAIKHRFSATFVSNDALIAAVTLPKFKVRWLKDEARRDAAKRLLVSKCQARIPEDQQTTPEKTSGHPSHDFFMFEEEPQASYNVEAEVMEYLRSPKADIESLTEFPRIQSISKELNTPTPSSAPVERLFSQGGMVLTPRRNRLSDSKFESMVLLRYNHFFCR